MVLQIFHLQCLQKLHLDKIKIYGKVGYTNRSIIIKCTIHNTGLQ